MSSKKYSAYKSRAKQKGLQFNLTKVQFNHLLKQKCHYCGADHANCVDRVFNQYGYSPENVVSCCWTCNRAKSDMDYFQYFDYLNSIRNPGKQVDKLATLPLQAKIKVYNVHRKMDFLRSIGHNITDVQQSLFFGE